MELSLYGEKEGLTVKLTINTILPLALAVILPGLSLYSQLNALYPSRFGFAGTWFFASVALYVSWYVLWFLWRPPATFRYRWLVVVAGSLLLFAMGTIVSDSGQVFRPAIFRFILSVILFLAIQFALKAQQNIARLRLEKEQIQTEQYRFQLNALRTKVDPHFLFNSLNTLRSMIRQKHHNSEAFVMSLSDFYRQTLKHEGNVSLPLSEELSVLQSYLFVMQSRNEAAIELQIDEELKTEEAQLPTLALQIVLENCFKHNSMTSRKPLSISIKGVGDAYIEVKNNLQPKISVVDTSGVGLDLLRKRYELMKIEDGVLVEKTADHFMVKLKLIQ
ncbi:MAG: histidine kinase [Bacteroidota bacterium]